MQQRPGPIKAFHLAISLAAIALSAGLFASCAGADSNAAILWTDRPEFASYVELFNTSQSRYRVEMYYRASPAEALLNTDSYPDVVVGSWLKNSDVRRLYRPMEHLFQGFLIQERAFYPKLLALGNIGNHQYLLPVSFNIPALVFSREHSDKVASPFTLTLSEVRELSKPYSEKAGDSYIRMGFSPRWDDDCLYTLAALFDVNFREGAPLAWNQTALDGMLRFVDAWSREVNGSVVHEDDFAFKYLYDPPATLATSGRSLFSFMTSEELFTVSDERRSNLDFRWIEHEGRIPVNEGAPYLALCKKGRARQASEAFVQWFYNQDTQRMILEQSRLYRLDESVFGIAGGFSALKAVNEQVFPQFYLGLLGHVPPADAIQPPAILPQNWLELKDRVVVPWLRDKARAPEAKLPALEQRLADWLRQNRSR